jgi:hypothetical protein
MGRFNMTRAERAKRWREKNPERWKEINKKSEEKRKVNGKANAYRRERRKLPWVRTRDGILRRINHAKHGRKRDLIYANVECHISTAELKEIWFRDNAAEMKRPSIDRIDPNGHYTKENCRYVELSENRLRSRQWDSPT